ncbi:uncharacterized protein LOC111087810 [Limulus polyphemus]|uniref:Uncharacterized protein LOC111087810 n=1 Tax=Limulus polyphemus TaxID=6850 RepID=A0ABM1T6N5_LIMPO|nr:uncharacterized protein LOC111087810 [Limulus polyphemus]
MTNDVFLMVRRRKTTIFLDAKETTPVLEMKRMIEGITKVSPENQKLFYEEQDWLNNVRVGLAVNLIVSTCVIKLRILQVQTRTCNNLQQISITFCLFCTFSKYNLKL